MLFEYRVYTCFPGKREEFVKLMEEEVIPFQIAQGAVVIGSFIDEQNADKYIWMRRFDDEAARVKVYAAIYESERWKTDLLPKVLALIDREKHQITRLLPTPRSVIR